MGIRNTIAIVPDVTDSLALQQYLELLAEKLDFVYSLRSAATLSATVNDLTPVAKPVDTLGLTEQLAQLRNRVTEIENALN